MWALCWAQARTEASRSMAIIFSQRPESANAIVFPPAPAKMSIRLVLEGEIFLLKSEAIWLFPISHCKKIKREKALRSNGFWSNPEPCIIRHANTFIIFGKYTIALVPIPIVLVSCFCTSLNDISSTHLCMSHGTSDICS